MDLRRAVLLRLQPGLRLVATVRWVHRRLTTSCMLGEFSSDDEQVSDDILCRMKGFCSILS